MKKVMSILTAMFAVMAVCAATSFAQNVLSSSVTSSFNTAIDTTSKTGLLISTETANARVNTIDISWLVDTSTCTMVFYHKMLGTTSAQILYEVRIPSGAVSAINYKTLKFDTYPLQAKNGLSAVMKGSSAKDVTVNVMWW
jgi:hypothetical protein